MKRFASAASICAALCVLSAAANAQATGFVSAGAGQLKLDIVGIEDSTDLIAANGSISTPVGPLLLQADVGLAQQDTGSSEPTTYSGALHLGYRSSGWAAGAYYGRNKNDDTDAEGEFYGAEIIAYLDQLTLSLGASAGTVADTAFDAEGVSGEARFFVTDNLRLDARAGVLSLDNGGITFDGPTVGAGAEWKPQGWPISFFASIDNQSLETDSIESEVTTSLFGLRFDFGSGTLKARDRTGPAFRPMAGLGGPTTQVF